MRTKKVEKLREEASESLQQSIREILNPTVNKNSAKGVDVFGRNKEQIELARLHRAGAKGIRIK